VYSEREHGLRIRFSIGHREEVIRSLVIPLNEASPAPPAPAGTRFVNDVRADPRYLARLMRCAANSPWPMLAPRGKLGAC